MQLGAGARLGGGDHLPVVHVAGQAQRRAAGPGQPQDLGHDGGVVVVVGQVPVG